MKYNFCLSCFNSLDGEEKCPHCGSYQNKHKKIEQGLVPGTELNDRYLIGEVLGFGGFGITYKVFDTKLNQILAIKEYFPTSLSTRVPNTEDLIIYKENEFQTGKKKFIEEAKNTGKFFGSKNIVSVFEYFEENNTAYYVMEYLDGISLKDFLSQNGNKLDVQTSVDIITGILDGLDEIHGVGLTHCDMTLDNIMLTLDGRTVIIDLGAAKYSNLKSVNEDIVVKMGYSPPEQYQGNGNVGAYTDMYAVGAMLYKLLTGALPDESLDRKEKETLKKPSEIVDDIPENIDRLCIKALALNSELRIQTAEQFRAGLNGKLYRIPDEEVKMRKIRTFSIIGAVAVVMMLCISLGIAFRGVNSEVNLNKYIKEDTTVEIWVPYSVSPIDETNAKEIYEEIAEQFKLDLAENDSKNKLKANIDIKIEYIYEGAYAERLYDAYCYGGMPDVYRTDLVDAEYMRADLGWVKDKIIKDNYALGTEINNYIYELPVTADADVMYVNRKFDPNNQLTSATTVTDLSTKLTELMNDDLNLPIAVSNSCLAIKRTEEMGTYTLKAPIDMFMNGGTLAYVGKMSELSLIKERVKWYTMTQYPDAFYNYTPAETWGVSVSADESHQYASMYVLSYLLSDNAQEIMCIENTTYIPLNASILDVYVNETHQKHNLGYLLDVSFEIYTIVN